MADSDKKDARNFARNAKLNTPYFFARPIQRMACLGGGTGTGISEVTFTRRDLFSGLPASGTKTAKQYWLEFGPLYEDRDHPDLVAAVGNDFTLAYDR